MSRFSPERFDEQVRAQTNGFIEITPKLALDMSEEIRDSRRLLDRCRRGLKEWPTALSPAQAGALSADIARHRHS